jgi:hypothetical protein
MPNHTTNFVTIETNTNVQEEIQALEELKNDLRIKEDMFDFNGIIPMPEEIKKGATLGHDFETGEKIEHKDYALDGGVYKPKHRLARKRLMMNMALIIGTNSLVFIGGLSGTLMSLN